MPRGARRVVPSQGQPGGPELAAQDGAGDLQVIHAHQGPELRLALLGRHLIGAWLGGRALEGQGANARGHSVHHHAGAGIALEHQPAAVAGPVVVLDVQLDRLGLLADLLGNVLEVVVAHVELAIGHDLECPHQPLGLQLPALGRLRPRARALPGLRILRRLDAEQEAGAPNQHLLQRRRLLADVLQGLLWQLPVDLGDDVSRRLRDLQLLANREATARDQRVDGHAGGENDARNLALHLLNGLASAGRSRKAAGGPQVRADAAHLARVGEGEVQAAEDSLFDI
mmetsp:Transcript_21948/g.55890  ORF Transcript_21948/g.55890 Transcript_21948/m.55890 type:complete len:284 (+) Transcript_21948:361-1212(+)